jgi:molybdenum cofactor guanylyltransferase
MGRDKAAIEIDGIPMIRRIYDVVSGCQDPLATQHLPSENSIVDRIHIVTPWAERYRSILPGDCHFIREWQPDRGPLLGFVAGLAEIKSTWVLLLACDLPNLSTPLVQTWIDGLHSIPPESVAYLPKHVDKGIDGLHSIPPESVAYLPKHVDKGWEPLCGFYRQICLDSLREYIDGGGQSFQGWLAMNRVTELPIDDPICLANCNTPADLAKIVEGQID